MIEIAGIQKNSTIDFPGVLSMVLFTPGCNFDCYYCHNRQLLDDPELLPQQEITDFLEKRIGLIDGVVISGGEPTMQKDLHVFLRYLKNLGYKVKLDTNGSNPQIIKSLLDDGLVDFVAVDYKTLIEDYEKLCGMSGGNTAETFRHIMESDVDYELRTTVIPEISHSKLYSMAVAYPNLKRFSLQLYIPDGEDNRQLYKPNDLRQMAERIKHIQPNVIVKA